MVTAYDFSIAIWDRSQQVEPPYYLPSSITYQISI